MLEEKLPENAAKLESVLIEELGKIPKNKVVAIRCRGLMCAIDIHESKFIIIHILTVVDKITLLLIF